MFSTSNILLNSIKYYEQKAQHLYFVQYQSNILYRYITDIYFDLNCVIIHNLDIDEIYKINLNDGIYGEDCKKLFENFRITHDLYECYLNFNFLPENIKNIINN